MHAMRASPVRAAARWERRSTATSLWPMLPGGAVTIDQIYGPAGAGNEGYGVDVRIGMMLPMSVWDGAARMPT